ncbi:MAG: tetratricopeptide repeat protein [Planctomycetes bacterium]|nr:tetratricopeptide repeat protein [Planctomycetota bacterium]
MTLEAPSLSLKAAAAAVIVAACAPYLGVLDAPFVFDDAKLVKDNELLRLEGPEAWSRLRGMFDITSREWDEKAIRENYRPLRFLSYFADYRLSKALLDEFPDGDPPPFFFHLQNILWHALNALLVLAIGRRLLGPGPGSLLLALLFALHPLQTEAVTYISSRRDVLSTFFFLAVAAIHLRAPPERAVPLWTIAAAPLLFYAGFLAKEMVITLPAILLGIDILRGARWRPRRLALHGSLWAVAAWCIWVTIGNRGLIAEPVGGAVESTYLTASRYAMRYLGLLLFPVSQSLDYSFDAIPASRGVWDPPSTLLSMLGVAAMAGVAVWGWLDGRRSSRLLSLGVVWFLVALAPVLQIVPIPERFAERFAYLPSIGIALVAALALEGLIRRERRIGWTLSALVLASLLAAAWARNEEWSSPLSIWASAASAQPRSARAHLGYANALREAGRLREAVDEYSRALAIWEENPAPLPIHRGLALQARMFRGSAHAVLGREDPLAYERGVEDLQRVLASRDTDGTPIGSSPKYSAVRFDLGVCLRNGGRRAEAEREFLRVAETGGPPGIAAQAQYQIARIRLQEEDIDGAVHRFRLALRELSEGDPSRWSILVELADALVDLKDDPESAWEVLEDVERSDAPAEMKAIALVRKARILDRKGEIHACIDRLEEALHLDPDSSAALVTLAGIETNLGRWERAEERYQRVLRRDPTHEEAREGLQNLRIRRQLVESGQEASQGDVQVIRGLWSNAEKHLARSELPAAREVYTEVARKALDIGELEMMARAYGRIAEVEERLGRSAEAERALLSALRALPQDAQTLLDLARLRRRRGDDAASVRDSYLRYFSALEEAARADPLARFELAELLSEKNPQAAVDQLLALRRLGEAPALGVEPFAIEKLLGFLYLRLERFEESLDAFDRYLAESDGKDADEERERITSLVNTRIIPRLIEP